MSIIIRLKNTGFSNEALPKLGDYGQIVADDLLGLYKMADSANRFIDSSGRNNHFSYIGTGAEGAAAPTFANGVLTLPDTTAAGLYHQLQMAGSIAGQPYTFFVLHKPSTNGTYYLNQSTGGGVNILRSGSGGALQIQFSNGTNRVHTTEYNLIVGVWRLTGVTVDSEGFRYSVDGAVSNKVLFSSLGGAPAAPSRRYTLGNHAFKICGDFAFAAQYNRAMSEDEMRSLYLAVKTFASKKGIAI